MGELGRGLLPVQPKTASVQVSQTKAYIPSQQSEVPVGDVNGMSIDDLIARLKAAAEGSVEFDAAIYRATTIAALRARAAADKNKPDRSQS